MGTKKEELESTTGCLAKAAPDEPIFVLRAHDELAPDIVRLWAQQAAREGTSEGKCLEALKLADRMEQWQIEHGRKVPD
jgi:hypothetical protein